jgi:hypothetical protein
LIAVEYIVPGVSGVAAVATAEAACSETNMVRLNASVKVGDFTIGTIDSLRAACT